MFNLSMSLFSFRTFSSKFVLNKNRKPSCLPPLSTFTFQSPSLCFSLRPKNLLSSLARSHNNRVSPLRGVCVCVFLLKVLVTSEKQKNSTLNILLGDRRSHELCAASPLLLLWCIVLCVARCVDSLCSSFDLRPEVVASASVCFFLLR